MWISAEHRNARHPHHLSQPQQPENDYEDVNGQVKTEPQTGVVYGVIEKDPGSYPGRDEVTYANVDNKQNDAVIYSDLKNKDAGSHTVTPVDQLYAKVRK